MSTECIVPIVELQNVRTHENSDNLDIAEVLGYQVVIRRGSHKSGDKVVYFPSDTIIPVELADSLGVRKFLRGSNRDRIGKTKLLGEPSFGLIAELPEELSDSEVGDNVASYFGAIKHEPPMRVVPGNAAPQGDPDIDPFFLRYTDVQNGRIYHSLIPEGEPVLVMEKIHGSNVKLGIINGTHVAGSMGRGTFNGRRYRPTDANGVYISYDDPALKKTMYWYPWSIPQVRELLYALDTTNVGNILIYGEIYGGSVQKLTYGIPKGQGIGFCVFDININGQYLDSDVLLTLCKQYKVDTAPVLGTYPYSLKKMLELAGGRTLIRSINSTEDNLREGVVVRPLTERTHPKVGRLILKFISDEYELQKNDSNDFTDV